jgi:hypothetical protein
MRAESNSASESSRKFERTFRQLRHYHFIRKHKQNTRKEMPTFALQLHLHPCHEVRHRVRKPPVVVAAVALLLSISSTRAQNVSFGQRLYHDKADCQFCHGVEGDGHGDPRSPGKAPNLHLTKLDRAQLIEVVACGRLGTEMPHFDKYAYEDSNCYGLSADKLGKNIPPDPHSTPLTKREIEAVVDFILATFVGK